ncbi:VOC family protein [Xylanimonas protaetiae]|uniref:VOC family protein n=1 Tax=Xylanimonas protaetiae TaxID=2509457 RepID=A0A4P6F6R7_9MICO|nr:VOC family protein [Xylanimonas protaetiae]QAY70493.1 VOC family protein [Xylanimonas protaetiae]
MALHLTGIRIDATSPQALARFWAQVLRGEAQPPQAGGDVVVTLPDEAYVLRFVPTSVPKTGRNRMHFDLTSATPEAQAATVARALALGGSPYDVGQTGDEGHVVLADPEQNEFCVIEAENRFLAGRGSIGGINCDGTRVTGEFWRAALGWELSWDEEEEIAITPPAGGSTVTWSGPPLMDKPATGRNRLRLEVTTDDDVAAETARLVRRGATVVDAVTDSFGTILLADPDSNELHLG